MPKVLVAATSALLLLITASALWAQTSSDALKKTYLELDDQCRGGSGDDPATIKACDQRNVVSAQLRKLNICIVDVGDGFGDCSNAPSETAADVDAFSARKYQDNFGGWHLAITARTDVVSISWLTVNRGNCSLLNASTGSSKNMRFGQIYDVVVACDPIEISIQSESGTQILTWDE
ncbi:hypothetical protein LGH82_02840 [Mesorhizobium sp. PAMC28654]|uniref:hypothetical protein n=1 Tax=Mesorhizobium sp. PAMC28654 TaxID=2880934 RepID=UPI001D0BA9F6|nr:hypothetical protein [Mesorhizobium sp. PAMC28654]UDL90338.1 hypothetical protein LGH82_02840 [Mesorhizobium sp. PAMC28654]